MAFETWNRNQLFEEVWEEPLRQVAKRYGISDVALGKVCRKLLVPVPGRGYWAMKAHGKGREKPALPDAANVPTLFMPSPRQRQEAQAEQIPSTDAGYLRILEVEARQVTMAADARLVGISRESLRQLKGARCDERGMTIPPSGCIEVSVSRNSLQRAVRIMDAVIRALGREGFSVELSEGKHGTRVVVFGQLVAIAITEKARVSGTTQESGWKRTVYEPTGDLEFRVGSPEYSLSGRIKDGARTRLEGQISLCVGAVLREGRRLVEQAQERARWKAEWERKEQEKAELARQIDEEQAKVTELERWVREWGKAHEMREFIKEVERTWSAQGVDLSPESPKGKRLAWMRQQADRLDPFIESPPSILDRKS